MTSTHSRRRAAACKLLEGYPNAGLGRAPRDPIVRRYISDYGKLRDAIRLLRKKRKKQ
jgi:hypothetical protein